MLHRIAFHLSDKVVALHLENAKTDLYSCDGTVSVVLYRLACHILSLADKHCLTLNFSIHTYPFLCERWLLWGRLSQNDMFFLPWLKQHLLFGINWRSICWHPHIPINVSIITPWRICHGVECFQTTLDIWSELYIFASYISSLSSIQHSGRTCHRWN